MQTVCRWQDQLYNPQGPVQNEITGLRFQNDDRRALNKVQGPKTFRDRIEAGPGCQALFVSTLVMLTYLIPMIHGEVGITIIPNSQIRKIEAREA